MNTNNTISMLKKQLIGAAAGALTALVALSSTTYAWYVSNNTVKATTNTVSAKTNGFVLQINDAASGADHGSGTKSLEAFSNGGILSPASSDDITNWYICQGMNDAGKVVNYKSPDFDIGVDAKPGQYTLDKKYFAFIKSDYIVYTISQTGLADVYLEDDGNDPPIVITAKNGNGVSTFTDSLRVAITTEPVGTDGKGTGTETLKVVYAVKDETGQGNDFAAIDGWTSIKNDNGNPILVASSYNHIFGTGEGKFIDQSGKNWVASKSGDNYTVPDGSVPIAEKVDYNGTIIHVYIWMEGTDADCVNGKAIENDTTTYDVTVKLAGVATSGR